jgi:cell division topological specificity factor
MSDHLSLAPEMIESMKRDLVDVISRYVEVDREKIDVHFEHEDHGLAMLANIPITGVNRNNGNGSGDGKNDENVETRIAEPADVAATATPRHGEPVEPQNAPPSGHRRRKRRKGGSGSPAPAT